MHSYRSQKGVPANATAAALVLSSALLFHSVSLPPVAEAQNETQQLQSEDGISRQQTLQNLDRLLQLGKEYGKLHAAETIVYQTKLKTDFHNDMRKMMTVAEDSNHPLYSLANDAIGSAYYDRLYLLERMGASDPEGPWRTYAGQHAPIWIAYIIASDGTLPGRWSFGKGLALYYSRTKDPEALKAFQLLIKNGHYTREGFPDTSSWALSESAIRSREVAYGLRTQIAWDLLQKATDKNHPRSARIDLLADFALGHIQQWFDNDAEWLVPYESGEMLGSDVRYARPFMVALTVQALLDYAEAYKDLKDDSVQSRIKKIDAACLQALEAIWNSSWNQNKAAFAYTDRALPSSNRDYDELGQDPQPDLNMLLAPLYYWVGKRTSDPAKRDTLLMQSDLILDGAVRGVEKWSWQHNKQYNQQFYHDTIGYIEQRKSDLTNASAPTK